MLKIIAIINLIAAIQSFFLFIHFLIKKKGVSKLNRLMATLTFAFTLLLINTYVSLDADGISPRLLQDLANNVMWFVGPLLYIYVLSNDKNSEEIYIYYHLYPFFLPSIIDICSDWQIYDEIIPYFAFTQMLIYLFLALRFSLSSYQLNKEFYSWIMVPLIVFTLLVLINFFSFYFRKLGFEFIPSTVLQSFTAFMSIPIFYISYKEMNTDHDFGIVKEKYVSSKLSDEKKQEIISKLKTILIEKEQFKVHSLTLNDLSGFISVPSKYISQVINEKMLMSFSEYLKSLRVEEARKNLDRFKHYTIAAIASESGFSSISSFNNSFKKITGMTPKEYQQRNI